MKTVSEKSYKDGVQKLKDERVSENLSGRILRAVLQEDQRAGAPRRTQWTVAVSACMVCVLIAVGALIARPASASIADVQAAFLTPLSFTVRTYQLDGGERRQIAQTDVRGDDVEISLVGKDGTLVPLEPWLQDLTAELSKQIERSDPGAIAKPGALNDMVDEFSAELETELLKHQGETPQPGGRKLTDKEIDALREQIDELSTKLDELVKEIERLTEEARRQNVVGGNVGLQYTRQLLKDEDIWERKDDVVRNGRKLHHFALKGGYQSLDLYVEPGSYLPVLARLDLRGHGLDIVLEDEYDYAPSR